MQELRDDAGDEARTSRQERSNAAVSAEDNNEDKQEEEEPLPTQREFLTSLLDAICAITVPSASELAARGEQPPPNPLRHLDEPQRNLIMSLHVIYPEALLPALDLLDRRLVTRVVRTPAAATAAAAAAAVAAHTSPATEKTSEEAARESGPVEFHLVRSAPGAPPRKWRSSSSAAPAALQRPPYVVRLSAWHCTCERYALEAFSPGVGDEFGDPFAEHAQHASRLEAALAGGGADGWQFGGLSLDGLLDVRKAIPLCKHLLAALLGERWKGVMGGYVIERRMSREEMAGTVYDL